jgi:hypothetical protein
MRHKKILYVNNFLEASKRLAVANTPFNLEPIMVKLRGAQC